MLERQRILLQRKGGTAEENAVSLLSVLDGAHGAYRDITLFNAGAGLVVAGATGDLKTGISMAAHSIDSGAARNVLKKLVHVSNSKAD